MKESLVFLGAKRTAFGANGGSLKNENPTELALCASIAAIKQAGVAPDQIDHSIFGSLIPSSRDALYLPRHVGLKVGMPEDRPALGINRLCGTSFQVVVEAYQQMCTGDTKIALVGGSENMSASPYALRNARWGLKMGNSEAVDMLFEALEDTYAKAPMAITAENLAVKYGLSRDQVDQYALRSQKLTLKADLEGCFEDEITPYEIKDRKGNVVQITKDEHPRKDATIEALSKLKPVFKKDGVVTAGNASGIVDGAGAMVVATEAEAKRLGLNPLGRLVSYGIAGCDPKMMGIGPVPAIKQALKKAGLTLDQIDLIEVNEAFAAQALSVQKELQIPDEKFNIHGGAIAIGHPLAATGARITSHLLYQLRKSKQKYAIASACIGGGQGIALVLEAF